MKSVASLLLVAILASGCATDMYGNQQGFASVVGAVGGGSVSGLACSRLGRGNGKVAITAACALAGGIAGLGIGNAMDRANTQQQDTMFRSPPGSQFRYQDPQSGSRGNLLILQPTTDNGSYCREFQHEAYVGGRMERMHGKACQQSDGSWRIVG